MLFALNNLRGYAKKKILNNDFNIKIESLALCKNNEQAS